MIWNNNAGMSSLVERVEKFGIQRFSVGCGQTPEDILPSACVDWVELQFRTNACRGCQVIMKGTGEFVDGSRDIGCPYWRKLKKWPQDLSIDGKQVGVYDPNKPLLNFFLSIFGRL